MSTRQTSLGLSACWLALGVAFATAASSCTLAFDNSVNQCSQDSECADRGFPGAVCNTATNTCEHQCDAAITCESRGLAGQYCNPSSNTCELECGDGVTCDSRGGDYVGKICSGNRCVAPDPTWACLDQPEPQPTNSLIEFRFQVVDTSRNPLSDVKMRACSALDPSCSSPVVDYVTARAGLVTMSLLDNFKGFFELIGVGDDQAGATRKYVPLLLFLPPRQVVAGAKDRRLIMYTPSVAKTLMAIVGRTYDVDVAPNAVLIATALTCEGKTTAGISFGVPSGSQSPSTSTVEFYTTEDQLPNADLTETSSTGTFGLSNLNEGSVALTVNINPLQRPLVSNNAAAFVRTNWISNLFVSP